MERTNYRLERWIAAFLGLLFFLPFVAKGDELLYTQKFHDRDVQARSGEKFLALVFREGGVELEPVSIRVTREYDAYEEDGSTTTKKITVDGLEDNYLLRGRRLKAGPLMTASPERLQVPEPAPYTIDFGRLRYTLEYRCGDAPDDEGFVECTLVLGANETEQVLGTIDAFFEARNDLNVYFAFAGDLDRDGRLDLIIDLAADVHEWHPALFLSSAAAEGQLMGKAAELIVSGC